MNNNHEYFIVRSEGGLGAQIVAASAYFFKKHWMQGLVMDIRLL